MKRIKWLIIALILLMPQIVFAEPAASLSTSASSIENGKAVTLTVTLTDTAAWNIKMTGSGAATCSQKQADVTADGKSTTKTFSLSCTATAEGTITFTVTGDITSGAGVPKDISLSKQVTVTKPKSGVNTLSDLKVDGTTVSGFSSSNTTYTINDFANANASITATATDSKASISGTGNKTLQYGRNSYNIVVTAENGTQKTYTIVINRKDPRSTNNNLKSLSVDKGKISFSKDTLNYSIKVEHDVNEINISASPEDSKATVSGTGKKTLQDYANEFKVVVKAENGATKTYTINVIRKDKNGNYGKLSTDNSAKTISVTNYDIKFNKDTKSYNVLVDENVNEVEIKVVPNDEKATVSIQNNKDLKAGLNKVKVSITAENGEVNEYLLNVYKMGEDTQEEEEKPSTEEETTGKGTKKINIWLIIAIIEFIIILLLLLLKKKDNHNISNNSHNSNEKANQKSTYNHFSTNEDIETRAAVFNNVITPKNTSTTTTLETETPNTEIENHSDVI